jgi:peroxiredoxin
LQPRFPAITLLTDPDKTATAAWGVLPSGGDEPDAAVFVVNRSGVITYQRRGDDARGDWPSYAELLAALN